MDNMATVGQEKTCPKCGYRWVARKAKPKRCPRCKTWMPEWRYEAA